MDAATRLPPPCCSSPPRRNLLPVRFSRSTAASACNAPSRLSRSRIDNPLHFRNAVRREAALFCMLPHHRLIGSDIDTVNFVLRNIALDPLNLRPQVLQDAARLL